MRSREKKNHSAYQINYNNKFMVRGRICIWSATRKNHISPTQRSVSIFLQQHLFKLVESWKKHIIRLDMERNLHVKTFLHVWKLGEFCFCVFFLHVLVNTRGVPIQFSNAKVVTIKKHSANTYKNSTPHTHKHIYTDLIFIWWT